MLASSDAAKEVYDFLRAQNDGQILRASWVVGGRPRRSSLS